MFYGNHLTKLEVEAMSDDLVIAGDYFAEMTDKARFDGKEDKQENDIETNLHLSEEKRDYYDSIDTLSTKR